MISGFRCSVSVFSVPSVVKSEKRYTPGSELHREPQRFAAAEDEVSLRNLDRSEIPLPLATDSDPALVR
jgi:hypothetical protein